MNYIKCFSVLLLCSAFPVAAQAPDPSNGTWAILFDGTKTADVEGKVVVDGQGGTWKVVAQSKSNPCVGRESPIVVETASEEELVFVINRSKVLTGCKDITMRFRKVDDRKLQGELTGGRTISLSRE